MEPFSLAVGAAVIAIPESIEAIFELFDRMRRGNLTTEERNTLAAQLDRLLSELRIYAEAHRRLKELKDIHDAAHLLYESLVDLEDSVDPTTGIVTDVARLGISWQATRNSAVRNLVGVGERVQTIERRITLIAPDSPAVVIDWVQNLQQQVQSLDRLCGRTADGDGLLAEAVAKLREFGRNLLQSVNQQLLREAEDLAELSIRLEERLGSIGDSG